MTTVSNRTTNVTEVDVAKAWARLGVMLNVESANDTPDLERLLLDTARLAPNNVRLFILAVNWLNRFNAYVAGHRLARLVLGELGEDARLVLGLMLEWAEATNLRLAIDVCRRSTSRTSRPLSNAENSMSVLRRQAEQSASDLSKKWGRWLSDDAVRMKHDVIRPVAWVAKYNPILAVRSTLRDVAASVVAEWPKGFEVNSVLEVARKIGATRLATDSALHVLELAGRVELEKAPGQRGTIVRVLPQPTVLAMVLPEASHRSG